jgi:hypothetical protein
LKQTPALAARLTDHIWSIQEVLTYKVPPHVLLKAQEAERQYLVQPSDQADKPKGVRGGASKYYLILLKLKQEKERRLSNVV